MTIWRICLHSVVLTIINISSIILAFGVYQFFRPIHQIAVQAPVAAILCIIAFVTWSMGAQRFLGKEVSLQGTREFVWTYFAALLWNPIIFVPLHYIGRGYLTSFGNILALWMFQLPVNLLAILIANKLSPSGRESVVKETPGV